jgi:hypothetical protein
MGLPHQRIHLPKHARKLKASSRFTHDEKTLYLKAFLRA